MRLRGAVLCLFLLTIVAGPAAAAPAPQVTDACGDAGTRGEWNGDSMDFEESRPHLDLKAGSVGSLYAADATLAGFTASITVCGQVSAADGGYGLGWDYGDGCHGQVSWTLTGRQAPTGEGVSGGIQAAAGPQAIVTELCYRERRSPLDSGVDTKYRVALPDDAYTFEGDTLTFRVATSMLPEAAAPRLAPGTEWSHIGAVAMDQGPSLWTGYGDSEGNRGQFTVRTDFALGGASFVVGEDAPR